MSPERWVSGALGSVETDGGAFNVLEGNHALNLAATYGLRPQLQRFLTLTGDYRDADLTLGLAPSSPDKREWLALEGNYGNGLGLTLEHRQQYKLNALRIFDLGRHQLTLFNDSYYGVSHEGNLVPIGFGVQVNDTVDRRRPKPSILPGASGPAEPACPTAHLARGQAACQTTLAAEQWNAPSASAWSPTSEARSPGASTRSSDSRSLLS